MGVIQPSPSKQMPFLKLTGARKKFFTHFAGSFIGECNFHFSDTQFVPAFKMLSPYQRLELIREILVGACCENEPLPKPSLLKMVAYVAFFEFIYAVVDVEIGCEEDEDYCHGAISGKAEKRDYKYRSPETPEEKELKDRMWEEKCKQEGKMNNNEIPVLPGGRRERGSVDFPTDSTDNELRRKRHKRSLRRVAKKSLKSLDVEFKRKEKEKKEKEEKVSARKVGNNGGGVCDDYVQKVKWEQKRLSQFLSKKRRVIKFRDDQVLENVRVCGCFLHRKQIFILLKHMVEAAGILMPGMPKMFIHDTFYTCREKRVWREVLRYIRIEFFHLTKGDRGLIYGMFENSEQPRYDFIVKFVNKQLLAFEKRWKPWKIHQDALVISCLSQPNAHFSELSPNPDEAAAKIKELEQQLGKLETEEKTQNGYRCERLKKRIKALKCVNLYHQALAGRPLDRLQSRLDAMLSVPCESYQMLNHINMNSDYCKADDHPQFFRTKNRPFAVFCGYDKCYNGEEGEVVFKKCSACRVQRYCSRECQRKHWKIHKIVCGYLKEKLKEKK